MNILLISPFFYPEEISTGKYNTYLALKLAETHQVTVLCSHPLYPDWKPSVSQDSLENIEIIRGGGYLRYPKNNLLRRALLEFWFAFFVCIQLLRSKKKYDLIISIYPPNLSGFFLKILKKEVIHLGIIHDIQTIMFTNSQSVLRKSLKKVIGFIEEKSYLACNKLIFLSKGMLVAANKKYKIYSIPSTICYPFITIEDFSTKHNRIASVIDKSDINIVYSGALGEKQLPCHLIKLYNQISNLDSAIKFYIFSQGPFFEKLKHENENPKIVFHTLVSEVDLPELLTSSTIQVIPQDPKSADGAFPSKLPNVLASGTKILTITAPNSEIDNLLKDYPKALVKYAWEDDYLAKDVLTFAYSISDEHHNNSKLLNLFHINHLVNELLEPIPK